MRRRQVLAAAGLGATGSLAGCSRFEDGGTETETPEGQWELRGRVVNEDDEPRSWLVEARSRGGGAASASGTIPAGEEWAFGLAGQLREEELEVSAESDSGAVGQPWRPTECRVLSVTVTIDGGEPTIEEACRSES